MPAGDDQNGPAEDLDALWDGAPEDGSRAFGSCMGRREDSLVQLLPLPSPPSPPPPLLAACCRGAAAAAGGAAAALQQLRRGQLLCRLGG